MNRIPLRSIALLGVALLLAGCGRTPNRYASSWSKWEEWGYRTARRAPQAAHNISFALDGEASGRTRVAFCLQDEKNHYILELAPAGSYLGIVELGVERPLERIPGLSLADLKGKTVTIERRPLLLNILVDGAVVCSAADPTYQAGAVAFGGIESGLRLKDVKVTPVGEVYFSDNFMRTAEEAHSWRHVEGEWSIKTLKNPGRSINAFSFTGEGRPAMTVTGQPHWSCVEFRAACRGRGDTVIGLVAAYRDPQNYFMLRWHPRGAEGASRQIVRVSDGEEEILAESLGGYMEDQWYDISFWYGAGAGLVRIDDLTVFEVRDSRLAAGAVGFRLETPLAKAQDEPWAEFDDVLVRSKNVFLDDFARNGSATWVPHGGDWRYLAKGAAWNSREADRAMIAKAPQDIALNVAGDSEWRNYSFAADIGPWSGGSAGLAVAVNPGTNFYSAEWTPTALELCKTVNGRRMTLASSPVTKRKSTARMEIALEEGTLRLRVDGEEALSARDTDFRGGKVGLLARNTEVARFANAVVQPRPPSPPVIAFHETFAHETSDMVKWSTPVEDWEITRRSSANKSSPVVSNAVCWHRAHVPGDARVELKIKSPLEAGQEAALMVAGEPPDRNSGYAVSLSRLGEDAEGRFQAVLLREGNEVASAIIEWTVGAESVGLARHGNTLSVFAGGRELVRWRDEQPLEGSRVGMAASGAKLDVSDFNIYTPNVINYTFQTAPTDWRKGSGEWDVRNRWECDPRWSFFSGAGSGVVSIWNKRAFEGDMTLEFFAGIRMDRDRGNRYEYASDLNATICADGKDLNSGYSFVFGGRNNTVTRIYRENVPLAETSSVRIDGRDHHRHWYYIRITKRGGKLEMSVDGKRALSVEDPAPLQGNRLAIWTRNNGIVIGRVRISAERIGERESPDIDPPALPASIY